MVRCQPCYPFLPISHHTHTYCGYGIHLYIRILIPVCSRHIAVEVPSM